MQKGQDFYPSVIGGYLVPVIHLASYPGSINLLVVSDTPKSMNTTSDSQALTTFALLCIYEDSK